MHHAFVGRAGTDVVERCVIAVGVCWTVGRPEGGRGCVWAGLEPRLAPGSLPKVASQVPWIEIMAHYQPTRGTELDLEIS